MNYIVCLNCCNGYDEKLDKCPYCYTSKGRRSDGDVVFDDKAQYEISILGGMIFRSLKIPNEISSYIIPCEWGIVRFDSNKSVRWTYFCGLVKQVSINKYVQVTTEKKLLFLDIETGEKSNENIID